MKYLDYLAVALMILATVLFDVYCVQMMIKYPCMLDLKIFSSILGTLMMVLFTWAIYEGMRDAD